jgi:transposase
MKLSIGIDWSDQSHTICIRKFKTRRILVEFEIDHNATGIEQLENKVQALECAPDDCLVAIETNEGMLVNYLLDSGYAIHPIPPAAVKDYRGRRRRTGAKSDRDDAQILSDILCQDLHLYPRMASDSPLSRELQATYRGREQLVKQRIQVLNRLTRNLKTYFPVILGLFSGLDRQITRAFLTAFPTQRAAQDASPETIKEFLKAQGYTRTDKVPEIIEKLHAPTIPVPDWQAEAGKHLTQALLAELAVLTEHIEKLETRLAELLEQHPDAAIFQSLPRVGPVLAAGFIGELGDCRAKFDDASELQALAGTSPVTIQSGQVKQVCFRYACNKALRYLLQQFARQSARVDGSSWARGYLSNQIERGHSNSRAYRALANRWLVIIFRIWQDRTLYDEDYHLKNIAQHGAKSPSLKFAKAA